MTRPDLTQPYRLERRGYFWAVSVADRNATVAYGRVGSKGRSVVKSFAGGDEALQWALDALKSKEEEGYAVPGGEGDEAGEDVKEGVKEDVKEEKAAAPRRSARKRTATVQYAPVTRKRAKKEVGTVKKQVKTVKKGGGRSEGVIYVEGGGVYDVMMVLVDASKNQDKFIVLQLIREEGKKMEYVLYQRWGRTGTAGNSMMEAFEGLEEAKSKFWDKFREKTGLEWENREGESVEGKYRVVVQDYQAKYEMMGEHIAQWQYWVDDGVDGKETAWYDYDELGNLMAEQLYMEFQNNLWLVQRVVQSGVYAYLVDLESMTQTNVVHTNHTVRHIRRVPVGEQAGNDPPDEAFADAHHAINGKAKKPNVPQLRRKAAHHVKKAPPAIVPTPAKMEQNQVEEAAELVIPVDDACPNADQYHVVDDFDATLNQSNIMDGNNNNKYYRIQMLQHQKSNAYHVWTRWGRVGETRGTQTKLMGPFKEQPAAEKAFCRKFRDKTSNDWNNRDNFKAVVGKYELLEIDHTVKKDENGEELIITLKKDVNYLPSTLPKQTTELIELLFEKGVYTDALMEFDIDVRKMPLGALSTDQIQKGVDVLEEIETAINNAAPRQEFDRLSSKFYTTLPHDFGRRRPPSIDSKEILQRCYDMCNILLDMEKATSLMAEAEERASVKKEKKQVPHPSEAQYASLKADLRLVAEDSEEHDVVSSAFNRTKGYEGPKLLNIWRVERQGEAERFSQVKKLGNHYLLWHGSHIGVISAILATGLRIMPHSGGRVGRGIYLASENSKSLQYTVPAQKKNVGCMFLVEAALGKTCEILHDDCSLTKAPNGFDSVRACGRKTPAGFRELKLDEVDVKVPAEKPQKNPKAAVSSFDQDEYLIYNEAQARIRYVITVRM